MPQPGARSAASGPESAIRVDWPLPDVARLLLDMPGKSANVLTASMLDALESVLDELEQAASLRGVVLMSAKPRIFVAGADLIAIAQSLDWSDEQVITFCQRGQRMFQRLQNGRFISVAIVDGACLGGGLELALACDFRIASDEPRTILGLPEVKLGLIPGWAGTVRLPRLIGFEAAADLLVSGGTIKAKDALACGLVDRLVATDRMLATALQMVEDVHCAELSEHRRAGQAGPIGGDVERLRPVVAQLFERIQCQRDLHTWAPTVVLEQLMSSASLRFDAACLSEAKSMCRVWGSASCRGLLDLHFLGEHNRRQPGRVDLKVDLRPIERVGLIGLGVMGTAIAGVVSGQPVEVIGWDERAEARQKFAELPGNTHRRVAAGLQDLANCDLVIEAISENVLAKRALLAHLAALAKPTAILATNTSTIPLRALVDEGWDHTRFVGIHFCQPQLMQLVEVVRSGSVDESVLATAVQWVRGLGKSAVVVADSPGFVVNRLLAALFDESLHWVLRGHEPRAIDHAAREFGFQAGPFEIMDIIGIDTVVAAGRALMETGGPELTPSPLLPKLVKLGRLGRKSMLGFYRYQQIDGPALTDPTLDPLVRAYQRDEPQLHGAMGEHLAAAMLVQATQLLDEQVVESPKDIDWCVVKGFSFPAHRGGVLFWADESGREVVSPLVSEILSSRPGWQLSQTLSEWLRGDSRFYAMVS